MFLRLYQTIERLATWPVTALLVIVMLLCSQGFTWRSGALGYEIRTLDVRGWYTPEDVQQLMAELGESGRQLYAITEVTLDLVFPLAYGTLFSILILRLYNSRRAYLLLFPLGAMTADLLENLTAAILALTYSGEASPLAWFAAVCTVIKFFCFLVSVLLILAGGIAGLRKK